MEECKNKHKLSSKSCKKIYKYFNYIMQLCNDISINWNFN